MAITEWHAPRIHRVRPRLRLFVKDGTLTVERDGLEWARYDLEGRWRVALKGGVTYRRSLSGRVISIRYFLDDPLVLEQGQEGFHEVEETPSGEIPSLHEAARAWAAEALDALRPSLPEPWLQVLERAGLHDPLRVEQGVAAFRRAYQGDPITPPDQHDAILVQSTTGCAHNACSFCVFYRGMAFSIRTPRDFATHVEHVREVMGETLPTRRRVFFGDASALMVKPSLLEQHFAAAAGLLAPDDRPGQDGRPRSKGNPMTARPYSLFCDAFLTPLAPVEALRDLVQQGLGRVYLGIETGSPALLGLLRKPASPAGMLDAVRRLKEAGLSLSVIIMVGVGGKPHAEAHREETAALLKQMPLGEGDVVQFSEFFCMPGSDYAQQAEEFALEPLSRLEARLEMKRIRDLLGGLDRPGGARYQMYDARQLLY